MSGFVTPNCPNLTDYTTFVFNAPQTPTGLPIPMTALPSDSPWIGYSLDVAKDIVYRLLGCISPLLYTLAVYNFAMDRLLTFCPDQSGSTYFAELRASPPDGYGLGNFVPGVVTATSDVTTSTTLTAPEFMKTLTLANLAALKTPFGVAYLSIVQDLGPLWGIS